VTAHAFLGRPVPAGFAVREVVVEPGENLGYLAEDWRGCIVSLESGAIDISSPNGVSASFIAGDILWLSGLPVSALENPGPDPAVLVAVRRSRTDEF
jgi:hypothetical protein